MVKDGLFNYCQRIAIRSQAFAKIAVLAFVVRWLFYLKKIKFNETIDSIKSMNDRELASIVDIFPEQNYTCANVTKIVQKFDLSEKYKPQIENIISHEVKIRWVQANTTRIGKYTVNGENVS